MTVRTLLNKVNKQQVDVAHEPVPVSVVDETKDITALGELSFDELLAKYREVSSWLETHEAQAGTGNKFDINGRPYDPRLYERRLDELLSIIAEVSRRPVGEEI